MARVFISHSGRDTALASRVHGWLIEGGHEVFLDRDSRDGIAIGEQWRQRLHERLRWADAIVCLVTSHYVSSAWCTSEVAIAQSRGSRLLPLLAEPGVTHPLLQPLQHLKVGEDGVRAKLVEALRQLDAAGGSSWPDDRSPYPGLRHFDVDQHRAFFGRSAEVKGLAELVRSSAERGEAAVLLVVGPSGCGKSSLVRAGLVPTITTEPGWWTLAPMLPGSDPVTALVRELTVAARALGLDWSMTEVRRRLDSGGLSDVAGELLLAAPAPARRQLLIIVDQFEELLTRTPSEQRSKFVELIRPVVGGAVSVVATLRPEFLDSALVSTELAALRTHTYTLRPLRRDALTAVIEEPARLAGITVDAELVGRLVADTDGGEALPLLAYTLALLADGAVRGGKLLTSRYEQLGGVRGTLSRQADTALDEAVARARNSPAEVIHALLRLVTVDEHDRPSRWRVRRSDIPPDTVAALEPFVARRLLTTDTDDGETVIGVAHEAFLSAWAPLADAVAANSAALRARRRLEQATAEWTDSEHAPAKLWERGQLASAMADLGARTARTVGAASNTTRDSGLAAGVRAWRAWWLLQNRVIVTDRVELSPRARQFLLASIRRDRRQRRRSTTILTALLILALVGAGVAVIQLRVATAQQRLATTRQLDAQAETLRRADPRTALLLEEAAEHISPSGETRSALVQTLLSSRYAAEMTGHTEAIHTVMFSPNGHILATGGWDRTVILWDATNRNRPQRIGQPLNGHTDTVSSVAFSPDGRILATGSTDKTALLWDVTDPAQPRRLGQPLNGHTEGLTSVAFSPDGRILATGSTDKTVDLWDLTDPTRPQRLSTSLTDHVNFVSSVAFSHDGHTLATAGNRATILWDVTDPAQPHQLGPPFTGHSGSVLSLAFSPASSILATGDDDNMAVLWDVSNPAQPQQLGPALTGHTGAVFSLAFAPDGHALATGSVDLTAILWDVSDPARSRALNPALTGHTGGVFSVAFSADSQTLVTGSADKTAILWDLSNLGQPHRLGQPLASPADHTSAIAFSPDSHILAAAGADGAMVLWDVSDPARPRRVGQPLTGHTGAVASVAFSPDSHTLAAAGADGATVLWDVSDPARPRRVGQPLTGHTGAVTSVAFSPDGGLLATGSEDNTAVLWDVSDPVQPRRLGQPMTGHTGAVFFVAFTPDAHTLATGSADKTAIFWDVTDPAVPRRMAQLLTGHTSLVSSMALSGDGHTLVTGSWDRTAILWDISDPTQPRRLGPPLTGHYSWVLSVGFSGDGRTLVTGAAGGTAILWDVTDPAQPLRLGAPLSEPGVVLLTELTPDGHTLVTGSTDTFTGNTADMTVTLWDLRGLNSLLADPLKRSCEITRGGFNAAEWARHVPGLPYEDSCAR